MYICCNPAICILSMHITATCIIYIYVCVHLKYNYEDEINASLIISATFKNELYK